MTLLELELRLLIARHGRTKVLQALSRIGSRDLKKIEAAVHNYEEAAVRKERRRRSAPGRNDLPQWREGVTPETKRLLDGLLHAFEAHEFLPELRNAREFLERYGVPAARFRSRQATFPAVVRTLSERTEAELASIDEERRDRRGPMTIISEHLLGP